MRVFQKRFELVLVTIDTRNVTTENKYTSPNKSTLDRYHTHIDKAMLQRTWFQCVSLSCLRPVITCRNNITCRNKFAWDAELSTTSTHRFPASPLQLPQSTTPTHRICFDSQDKQHGLLTARQAVGSVISGPTIKSAIPHKRKDHLPQTLKPESDTRTEPVKLCISIRRNGQLCAKACHGHSRPRKAVCQDTCPQSP